MARVRGVVPLVVALVGALLAVGLLGFSSTLNPVDALLGRGAIVTLPDLSGDAQPRAVAELEDLGLVPRVVTAFSLSAPRGTIIGQSPRAGERVRQGSDVELVVSRGANRVEMPDAVGRALDEVEPEFDDAGIPVEIERVASESVPAGVVIEQSPGAGVQVTGEDTVRFVVSAGPADRPVPEVVGLSVDAAAFSLGSSGLVLGEIVALDDPAIPAGAIIASDPPPTTTVAKDTAVALTVSNGPSPVPVPDLVNRTESSATTTLEQAGFVVATAARLVDPDGAGEGAVFEQYPAPATMLRPGMTVTLVVGSELPPPPPPLVTTTTTTTTPTPTTTIPTDDGD